MVISVENIEFLIPERAEELTWVQLMNLSKLEDMSYVNVLSAICDVDIETVKNFSVKDVDAVKIFEAVKWISTFDFTKLLSNEVPNKIGEIPVENDFDKIAKFGQQIHLIQYMSQSKSMMQIRNEILLTFFGYQLMGLKTWDNTVDYQEVINKCNAVDAYKLTSFFLRKLKERMTDGSQSKKLNLRQTLKIFGQVLKNLMCLVSGRR